MAGEKGSGYANSMLQLIFNATTFTSMAINATTSPFAVLYVSLHQADPTAAGSQTSSEIAYTSYARISVARTSGGWTVTGNSVSPVANISFPACTGGASPVAAYWGVGTASSGAGVLLYAGPISPTITVNTGVTPIISTSSTITES